MMGFEMVGDSFRLGYRVQRHWDASMAGAFVCGELGAGLYLVSMFFHSLPGMVLGLLITGAGKSFFHLSHMGIPGRSWRAILRPDRSWISRGLIAIIVFCGAGALHAIDVAMGGVFPSGPLLPLASGAAALVVILYQGFAMSDSAAIALWNTAMMPFAGLLYAMTGGVLLVLFLQTLSLAPEPANMLVMPALALLTAVLIMLASIIHAAYHGSAGGRLSAELLIKGRYALWFCGVTIGIGLLLPAIALVIGGNSVPGSLVAAGGALIGFYFFRLLVFRAGVYEPVLRL